LFASFFVSFFSFLPLYLNNVRCGDTGNEKFLWEMELSTCGLF
jgi:hypothetical protein